jgi:hypothetical protein
MTHPVAISRPAKSGCCRAFCSHGFFGPAGRDALAASVTAVQRLDLALLIHAQNEHLHPVRLQTAPPNLANHLRSRQTQQAERSPAVELVPIRRHGKSSLTAAPTERFRS